MKSRISRRLTRHTKRKSKQTKKCQLMQKLVVQSNKLRYISLAELDDTHIAQLARLNEKDSSGTVWTEKEIKIFVEDEKTQLTLPDISRKFYSYGIFMDGRIIGYICGKKSYLLGKQPNKFDLLLVILIDTTYKNMGIGTNSINWFIKTYANKIKRLGGYARKARLFADIAPSNIGSIRVFEKNNFKYANDIQIKGKMYKRYYRGIL